MQKAGDRDLVRLKHRLSPVKAALDSSKDYLGCNLLKKYLRQLQFVAGRFPMKTGEDCETEISW